MLNYVEGRPIPSGYHVERPIRRAYALIGTLAFVIPYAVGVGLATIADFRSHTGWLALPVAGPWVVWLKERDSCSGSDCRAADAFALYYVLVDSALQAGGHRLLERRVQRKAGPRP